MVITERSVFSRFLLHVLEDHIQIMGRIEERIAVIGERQRNHAVSGDPSPDSGKDESVLQIGIRGGCGESHRLISVRAGKGSEPARGVKDGSAGVQLKNCGPAPIVERVNREDARRLR